MIHCMDFTLHHQQIFIDILFLGDCDYERKQEGIRRITVKCKKRERSHYVYICVRVAFWPVLRSGMIYSGSGSRFEFSEFRIRIQAKVQEPCGSGSGPNPYYLCIFKNKKNLNTLNSIRKKNLTTTRCVRNQPGKC